MCLAGREVNLSPPLSYDSELTLSSFDADLPLICNDEDLDASGPDHPTDTKPPTRMSCFVAAIKLNQILAFALRTIVCSLSPLFPAFNSQFYYSIQRGGQELFSATLDKVGKSTFLLL